ncbi:MAG TPA: ABC transporter permease [Bacteroidia bacterium]|nr:ABC transporter permease [Bacteroidia bacterium]
MNFHNLKIGIRYIKNSKLFSSIAVIGMTAGMTVAMLLLLLVRHELSYDDFHLNAKSIYRINSAIGENVSPLCIGLKEGKLVKDVPEIQELVQFYEIKSFNITKLIRDHTEFKNINLIYAESNFHKIFTLKTLRGDLNSALKNPNSIIITKSLALKLFASIDVLGKTLKTNHSNTQFIINGIIDDYPLNSNLKIDAIIPIQSAPFNVYDGGTELYTYVLFRNNINIQEGIRKVQQSYRRILSERMSSRGLTDTNCFLQKITDIHTNSDNFNGKENITYKKIIIYTLLAFVILLISTINFINILIVQYENKLKEIGIQKIIGASNRQIFTIFLIKSFILSTLAAILAQIIVYTLLPSFEKFVHMNYNYAHNIFYSLIIYSVLLTVIVCLFAGSYPALLYSKISSSNSLKNNLSSSLVRRKFNRVLVVVQFSVMIFLVSCVFVMKKQILFMKNADLGFNSEKVIAITDLNTKLGKSYLSIKSELEDIPEIISVGASYQIFGSTPSNRNIEFVLEGIQNEISIKEYRVFPGFFETLDFKFLTGRAFDESIKSDKDAIVINETAAKAFGLTNPLNTKILFNNNLNIIGVVKDVHYHSLDKAIEPLMFTYYSNSMKNIVLKISDNNFINVIPKVDAIIKNYDSEYILDYVFLDDLFRLKYQSQESMEKIFEYSSILSIIIAMLGLYAMTIFLIQKRIKEIGIRKINGAKVCEILYLINLDLTRWITIAFVIASPIVYFTMNKWLSNFAYRTELSWWIYILAGLLAFGIALITISWQSWQAATKNPVEAIRNE